MLKLGRLSVFIGLAAVVCAFAADPATVQDLRVNTSGGDVRIEITLSAPAAPNATTAVNPDRLVIELPNTVSDAHQRRIAVNNLGVRSVRIGLNSANPPVTRVVVDLEQALQYALSSSGNQIVLTVTGNGTAQARPGSRHGALPAAASGSLTGLFHKSPSLPAPETERASPALPAPPPSSGPAWEPPADAGSHSGARTASAEPSAKHPNLGGLQQGTVVPGVSSGPSAASGAPSSAPVFAEVAVVNAPGTGKKPAAGAGIPSATPNGETISPGTIPAAATDASARPIQEVAVVNSQGSSRKPAPVANVVASTAPNTAATSPRAGAQPTAASVAGTTSGVDSAAATAAASAGTSEKAVLSVPNAGPSPAAGTVLPVASGTVPAETKVAAAPAAQEPAITPSAPVPAASTPASVPVPGSVGTGLAQAPQPAQVASSKPLAERSNTPPPAAAPVAKVTEPVDTAGVASTDAAVAKSNTARRVADASSTTSPAPVNPEPTVSAPSSSQAQPEPAQTATANWPAPGSIPLAPVEPVEETVDPAIAAATRTQSDLHTFFRVKYVTEGAAYLEGGRSSGLAEGMKLVVRDDSIKVTSDDPTAADPRVTAHLEVASVADGSSVTEIKTSTREVKVGDLAWLSAEDEAALVQERTLSPTRKYPVVISFTENGDPMDEEVRAEVPRPPLPEINRARGRIGIDYNSVLGTGDPGYSSTQLGLVLRTDVTRIGGTYWNLSGYWRGRMSLRSSTGQPTLQDLLNRTYHLSMIYDNPNSAWVMGAGRMYLPWATSLDTIDGGYFGRRLKQGVTAGFFGGSTPDPTSWNYASGRRIAGGFINFQGGSFNSFRYFTTVGGAASTINGQFDRPFVFVENSLFYKRYFSLYSSVQADKPPGNPAVPTPGTGLARSFFTVRIQPHERIGFDFNYNYLRDVPTYDPALIGTGLLDKYLFQGFSAGVRAEVIRKVTIYTNLGRSNRSGDKQSSLNQLYGVTYANIWRTGLRADLHYSTFNSSFGSGSYEALSLARNVMEGSRLEVQVGRQRFTSSNASASNSRFLNAIFETNFGRHYFLQSGFTFNRGSSQNYDQWNVGVGYRFDNREKKRQ